MIEQEQWHQEVKNVESSLIKYGVISPMYSVMDDILGNKPHHNKNRLKKGSQLSQDPSTPTTKRIDPSKIYLSQEERVVGIKSETSVVDAQTSCLMQLSEPVEETTQETSAKIEEKNSKLVTRLTQVQNPVLNHI